MREDGRREGDGGGELFHLDEAGSFLTDPFITAASDNVPNDEATGTT